MAKIIRPGHKPEPPTPWYLKNELTCPRCNCIFTLDKDDFEGYQHSGGNWQEPTWKVAMTERTPNGRQHIEGKCPDCKEPIRLEGYVGGVSPVHPAFARAGRAV